MNFESDNASPAHPAVFEAVERANVGPMASYGEDEIMAGVAARVREIFEAPEAAVYLVSTGTAANALSIATCCPPWGAVFCHAEAHVETDECGAPEFYSGGAKLRRIEGDRGKIAPEALESAIAEIPVPDVHSVQCGMVSLTNVTEAGTVYAPDEVAALTAVAKRFGLPCHMDGARFANALASTGATPAEMTWKAGIDILSLGGTKNGLLGAEAVVLFDPARAWEFELRRKRGGHLWSKHRYLSAQFEAYLEDGLWLEMARNANARATFLASKLDALPFASLLHPVEANIIFTEMPRARHRAAMAGGASYRLAASPPQSSEGPGDEPLAARMVCSWRTEESEIEEFFALLRGDSA